ncbi:SpoIIE family protein phosphatase [Streptomyces sp. NBC_01456]|uniref:SpoIIE family protein phosphatase n=1 Tax=unclassified Streptomyces TaxID=2593676 RepID=UPI002E32A9C8|nr:MULTISPECIES: SpoIIE family protein phosphatase [unclassified Streptomyces]
MTSPESAPTAHIAVDHYSAVHLAAETARAVAGRCRLPGALPDQAAVIASELASNLAKHASGGSLYLQPLPLGGGMEIVAVDRGPGIVELQRCLADGYTTSNTLGAGLGAVQRIATALTIRTEPGAGTLVCARLIGPDATAPAGQEVGVVCLPADGEQVSGDACAVVDHGTARTAVVVDGLGHGPPAAEAAQTALRSFHRAPDLPLPELLTALHRALRRTRGAAVGLLRLHPGRAEYSGVGNVRVLTLTPLDVGHRLTGQPGIAGMNMATPQVRAFPVPPGATAVLHSDGIDQRWARSPSAFVHRLPPFLLAASLAHSHRLSRDDATVIAARPSQRLP